MVRIRCPYCGSPVMIRGRTWECGYCGDFGSISSLHFSGKENLAIGCPSSILFTVTAETNHDIEKPPSSFSRAELEDMVRRWNFDENEWACRDLLIDAFPQAVSRWSVEDLREMDTMDLLVETGQRDPETALQMVILLLNTAEKHLKNKKVANQLLGWDMYDLLNSDNMLPLLVEELKKNDRLACQLFQSAYVGQPQKSILNACGSLGEKCLQRKLFDLLACNSSFNPGLEFEIEE